MNEFFGENDSPDLSPDLSQISLKDFQLDAVRCALSRKNRGDLLYGKTGSGKTVTAVRLLLDRQKRDRAPSAVLIVTPSGGGNLCNQWKEHLQLQGVQEGNILMFNRISRRREFFMEWEKHVVDNPAHGSIFVIVTFKMLHNSVSLDPHSLLLTKKFSVMVVDECHFFRNGSHRIKEEDIDPEKKMFNSICMVRNQAVEYVLLLTATPFFNDKMDIYSLVVLMGVANGNKKAWQKTNPHPNYWISQRKWFYNTHVIPMIVPKEYSCKDKIIRHTFMPTLSEREVELAYDAYCPLKGMVEILINFISNLPPAGPALIQALRELEEMKQRLLGELTRCRRGLLHPAFYDPPIKKMKGQKLVTEPVPLKRMDDFSKEDCSKFNAVEMVLDMIQAGRVLITSQFSRPLDFLQIHLNRYKPEWRVAIHHGKTDCISAMSAFKEETKIVMLATAPSCGEGLDFSMTSQGGKEAVRLLCLDFPFSHAAQSQLEGRIKRPLAQPNVEHWHTYQIISQAFIERNALRVEHSTIDHALRNTISMKEQVANEIFMSEEEAEQHMEGITNVSTYGEQARENMKSLLGSLLEVCTQWANTEDPEHLRRRKEAIKRKRGEGDI